MGVVKQIPSQGLYRALGERISSIILVCNRVVGNEKGSSLIIMAGLLCLHPVKYPALSTGLTRIKYLLSLRSNSYLKTV